MVGYHIKYNGDKKHGTFDDVLPVVVKPDDGHALIDHAEQDCADDDAGHRTGAAVGGGPAEQDIFSYGSSSDILKKRITIFLSDYHNLTKKCIEKVLLFRLIFRLQIRKTNAIVWL